MTLILEVTPAAETVVTPCNVVRLLLASTVVDSIFLRGALFGFGIGITSTPPSRLTFFTFALFLALGFVPVCLSNIARLAGVRIFVGGSAGTTGAIVVALVSTLLDRSLALEDAALVDGALVLAEASERGARPRKLKGGVGRGAGVGIVGRMPVGASGLSGAAIGGAAIGGGKAGGFAMPEFQGATLAGLSVFSFLLYESNSRCCFLMTSSGWIVGAGTGVGIGSGAFTMNSGLFSGAGRGTTGIANAPAAGGGGGPGGGWKGIIAMGEACGIMCIIT
jgi:hypothetical protein